MSESSSVPVNMRHGTCFVMWPIASRNASFVLSLTAKPKQYRTSWTPMASALIPVCGVEKAVALALLEDVAFAFTIGFAATVALVAMDPVAFAFGSPLPLLPFAALYPKIPPNAVHISEGLTFDEALDETVSLRRMREALDEALDEAFDEAVLFMLAFTEVTAISPW